MLKSLRKNPFYINIQTEDNERWLHIERRFEAVLKARFELKLQDIWIGLYFDFKNTPDNPDKDRHLWVCFIPCVPLHIVLPPRGWLYFDHPF